MAGVAFNGSYGKEYSRLRRLTSNTDVIQQSVGKIRYLDFILFNEI